mmetsp:Transcript_96667/g.224124  ORF Transcript_96667/g.224124 Transcript_96667/m.224124 type:complete len:213 (-) Transcript_96667:1060-1698(-)
MIAVKSSLVKSARKPASSLPLSSCPPVIVSASSISSSGSANRTCFLDDCSSKESTPPRPASLSPSHPLLPMIVPLSKPLSSESVSIVASLASFFSIKSDSAFAFSSERLAISWLFSSSVLVKRLGASDRAWETAAISSCRVFWRSSHSLSVIWHFSFNIMRNFSPAEGEVRVSSVSCLACALFASVSVASSVLVSVCACSALTSSFAAFNSL